MSKLLEVVELRKTFHLHILNGEHIEALNGVSFDVEEGEIVALTGNSGAGKSSLMKCIFRTYLPTSGRLLYHRNGSVSIDLATAHEHHILEIRKSEMTYCSQFLQVIPRVPALEVVASSLIAKGSPADQARRAAADCFERLSLPRELWDAYPSTFSGGEQQRINIARAMISKPRCLLIDEPTASLDANIKDAVIDMMLELTSADSSIVLITHDEHCLRRIPHRSLHLENGILIEAVSA